MWTYQVAEGKFFGTPSACRLLGIFEGETITGVDGILHHLDANCRGPFREAWDKALEGKPFRLECRLVSESRRLRTLEIEGAPIYEGKKLIQIVGSISDVAAQAYDRWEEGEHWFKAASDAAPLGIFVCSPEGKRIYSNAEWQRISGLSEAESIGSGWTAIVHKDDRADVLRRWRRSVEAGAPFSSQHRYGRPDGTVAWVSVRAAPMRPDGKTIGYIGTVEDVTAQYEARLDLERSESRLQELADCMPHMVWVLRSDGSCDYCNQGFYGFTGLAEADLLAGSWTQAVQPEDLRRAEAKIAESFEKAVAFEAELRLRRSDGTYRWHLVRALPILDDGKVSRWIGTATDVHDAKTSERELRRLFSVLEVTSDLVATVDPEGYVMYMNPAGRRMLGWPMEGSLSGYHMRDAHPAGASEKIRDEACPRALESGCWNGENVFLDAEGNEVPVSQNLMAHIDAGEIYFSTVARDIRDQKRIQDNLAAARDAALEASRAKSLFLAGMSHEIRTPLNAVIGLTSLLNEKVADREIRELVRVIRSSGETVLRVIDDVLDFSKIEAGRMDVEAVPMDLLSTVHDTVALFQQHAREKGLSLVAEAPDALPTLLGDPIRIRQILANLVSNAIKFTHVGEVKVRLVAKPPINGNPVGIELHVLDSGVGIPEERLGAIFESFTQGESSTTRKYGGTGLGLTISRRLAELMGGNLGVKSFPGQGSVFTLSLRLERGPSLAAKSIGGATTFEGRRVLVAEDNPVNQIVVTQGLQASGCEVVVVDNGLAAISEALEGRYDLILMDMQMPMCDGIEASRAIRQQERRHVPIVALTANASEEDRRLCHEAGMDDFLSKPFTIEQLRSVMARWLPNEAELRSAS